MTYLKRALDERFWEKIQVTDECWEFQGAKSQFGYGVFQMGRGIGTRHAHILAWELARGPRNGMWVLHKCDNPPCCRPDHLYLGTQADNARDMSRRGRARSAKVTSCPRGHPYDPQNTYYSKKARRCRVCIREQRAARYRARRDAGMTPSQANYTAR